MRGNTEAEKGKKTIQCTPKKRTKQRTEKFGNGIGARCKTENRTKLENSAFVSRPATRHTHKLNTHATNPVTHTHTHTCTHKGTEKKKGIHAHEHDTFQDNTHTHIHTHTQTHIHTNTHTYTHTDTHTHKHAPLRLWLYFRNTSRLSLYCRILARSFAARSITAWGSWSLLCYRRIRHTHE